MEDIYQQQNAKQKKAEIALLQNMDYTIQSKIETISHTVATQDATQLTEVLKNYISLTQYILHFPTKSPNIRISQELSPEASPANRIGRSDRQMETNEPCQ